MFRVQDLCLIAIVDGRTLVADWLDALPPYRAIMLMRIAAAGPGPVTQDDVDTALAKARDVGGGGGGPGWLTGRAGRTCAECGHTTWPAGPDDDSGEFGHTGPCQAPPRSGAGFVTRDYGRYGLVLMPEAHSPACDRQVTSSASRSTAVRAAGGRSASTRSISAIER